MLPELSHLTTTDRFGQTAGNGHQVLEHLYDHPIVSVGEVQALIRTTYQAANELVSKFEDNAVLQEKTGQARNRRFMYGSCIDLFREDAQEGEPRFRTATGIIHCEAP